jgi:adenine phosphoribosyltransferase
MESHLIDLKQFIRDIPDWPKKGILFRDITPLLKNPQAFSTAVDALCAGFNQAQVEYVAAVEARGFIFGSAVAQKLGAGFVPIRKKGKRKASAMIWNTGLILWKSIGILCSEERKY